MKDQKLTESSYKCCDCGELKKLVIVRGRAVRCLDCYESHLVKLKTLRRVNQLFSEEA